MRLKDRVVIITGAGSGIGRASARLFQREGARLVLVDVDEAGLDGAVGEVEAAGGEVIGVGGDVSREADVDRFVGRVIERFGRIDVLFNNAGIVRVGKAGDLPVEDWDRVLDVNLKSVFLCCRRAIPQFIRQGGGVIVNMASMSGLVANPNYAAYNSAKAGVVNLTRNLALDYAAQNIRVNCVCPGSIDTPMLQRQIAAIPAGPAREQRERDIIARIPMGRKGRAEEVANVALFLASDEASYVTGAAFVVDGGFTIR